MRRYGSHLKFFCLAAALAACLWGCLQGDKITVAAYESTTDQFRFLTILRNIHSTDEMTDSKTGKPIVNDKWLLTLYSNRDHLIIPPVYLDIFGMTAFIRKSDSEYVTINLGDVGKLTVEKTKTNLNKIEIKPGQFFLEGSSDAQRLGYYQQMVVPGDFVDQVLASLKQSISDPKPDSIVGGIDHELNRRANGEPAISWEIFENKSIDSILNPSTQKSDSGSNGTPLEIQSLKLLRAQLINGQLKFQRIGSEFSITGELTSADVKSFLAFVDHFRSAMNQRRNNPQTQPGRSELPPEFYALVDCIKVSSIDASHIKISTDIIPTINALSEVLTKNSPTDDTRSQDMASDIAEKTDCLKNMTTEKIMTEFAANTLPAYPPKVSVPPGTGMGGIPPATQPDN